MIPFRYDETKARFIACGESQELHHPLLVNWNIIGSCCNQCIYCYGADIKSCASCQTESEIKATIEHLAYIRPSAIVITGGEPLLHPKIQSIIEQISTFSHVILDTNGLLLEDATLQLCKEKKVHLRISLDSDVPTINEAIRKSSIPDSTETIKRLLSRCVAEKIHTTVQTVVTQKNLQVLDRLWAFLNDIGITHWRLLDVVTGETNRELAVSPEILTEMVKDFRTQSKSLCITYVDETRVNGNNIILVDPLGQYFYRSAQSIPKKTVDDNNPCKPRLEQLMQGLDIASHIKRYTMF